MRLRLLASGMALGAILCDAGGVHGLASWLVLLAIPTAAWVSFLGVSDALAGEGRRLPAITATAALVLFVLGSAVRESAVQGGRVPALAVSTVVAALICYALPGLVWLLEPLRMAAPRPRASRA
jgi:hypothetical protein